MMLPAESFIRLGILMASDGLWEGKRLLPEGWIAETLKPSPANPKWGLHMWIGQPYQKRVRFFPARSQPIGTLHSEPYLADDLYLWDGSGNQATVGQTSNGNTDNTSLINQRASSIDGSANVQQSGDGTVVNNSNIDQSGGSNNAAGVTQSGLGSTHNLSTVIQTGSMNTATIGQSGASLSNTSTLHQTGAGNGATVTQN